MPPRGCGSDERGRQGRPGVGQGQGPEPPGGGWRRPPGDVPVPAATGSVSPRVSAGSVDGPSTPHLPDGRLARPCSLLGAAGVSSCGGRSRQPWDQPWGQLWPPWGQLWPPWGMLPTARFLPRSVAKQDPPLLRSQGPSVNHVLGDRTHPRLPARTAGRVPMGFPVLKAAMCLWRLTAMSVFMRVAV